MNTCSVNHDWKIRVIEERDELSCKLHNLRVFLDADISKLGVSKEQVVLLIDQEYFMDRYLQVLNKRIESF